MSQKSRKFILQKSNMITDSVLHSYFCSADNEPVNFVAGQFVTLQIPHAGKTAFRSYSIVTAPNAHNRQNNELSICCTLIKGGLASTLLENLKPGDSIDLGGPHGIFTLKVDPNITKRCIFIATGTGVAPYVSMQDDIRKLAKEFGMECIIILGVKDNQSFLLKEELLALNEANNCKFMVCYSRQETTNETYEIYGRVQTALTQLEPNSQTDMIMLCGNPDMVEELRASLGQQGFTKANLRFEKYSRSI